jgi:hypothetical protein
MLSHWRRIAAPIICKVLAETAGQPEAVVRRALREACPFGQRRYHPYRIWCDEIRVQMGTKHLRPHVARQQGRPVEPDARQAALFV